MTDDTSLTKDEPAPAKTSRSLLFAAGAAALVFVFVVLPAEYGIDPTGFGCLIGLTDLSRPSSSVPETLKVVTEGEVLDGPAQFPAEALQTQDVVIPVSDLGEVEYKLAMPAGATIVYEWKVRGETPEGGVYFDFHGHPPADGTAEYEDDFSTTFSAGEMLTQKGSLTAPFDGIFGWYFMNLEYRDIEVELKFTGFYDEAREIYRAVEGVEQTPLDY